MTASDRLDSAALDAVLNSLLATYTTVPFVAINPDGLFVPMPDSFPVQAHPVFQGHASMLDIVAPGDAAIVIDGWTRARNLGSATLDVHLATQADRPVVMHYVDATHRYGVYVGLLAIEGTDASIAALSTVPPLKPRVARVVKDELAFIKQIDAATTQLVGFTEDEMVGHRSLEFIDPEDHAPAIANWMDMLRAPGSIRRVRIRHRHRDGSWVWFEVNNHNLLRDPEHGCVLAEMFDITDEMAAQEALRAREHMLRRLAEALPLGIFHVAHDGALVYQNERLAAILGRNAPGTVDGVLSAIVPSDRPVLSRALGAAVESGIDADLEVDVRRRRNDLRRCTFSLRALSDDAGLVTGAIVCVSDVTESVRLRRTLEDRATFDVLTRCYNRASILQTLEQTLADNALAGAGTAAIFIDLDRFKELNDHAGHAAGDVYLVETARRLRFAVRDSDVVGRIGGDEFLVVCRAVDTAADALLIAERIRNGLGATQLRIGAEVVTPQASIGVAFVRGEGMSADALVARADEAMYQSKRDRLGQPVLFGAEAADTSTAA